MAERKLKTWLKKNAPEIADVVGDVLPDAGVLGVIRRLLQKRDPDLVPEFDTMAAEITARWLSDNQSSTLAKNTRPMVVLFMTAAVMVLIVLDSAASGFEVKERWTNLLEIVWLAAVGGYFGLRTAEKLRG